VHPHLVLQREAAGGVLLVEGGEAGAGETGSALLDLLHRLHLDAEVVERPLDPGAAVVGGNLDEDELERRLGDGEVGVPGLDFGGLGVEQLGVEGDCGIEVIDVECKL